MKTSYSWMGQSSRLSRRRLLAGSTALAAGALAASTLACGNDNSGSSPTTTAAANVKQPKRGGTIKIGYSAVDPATFDVHASTSLILHATEFAIVYSRLLSLKLGQDGLDNNIMVPAADLAEKWEQPDE